MNVRENQRGSGETEGLSDRVSSIVTDTNILFIRGQLMVECFVSDFCVNVENEKCLLEAIRQTKVMTNQLVSLGVSEHGTSSHSDHVLTSCSCSFLSCVISCLLIVTYKILLLKIIAIIVLMYAIFV